MTPRGYTGHEMLDDLGLVHMNGRIYDPLIGRMLSADEIVQYPSDLQSYNRYSYVRNNPLAFIDPSGFADVNLLDSSDAAHTPGNLIPDNQPGVTTIVMHGANGGNGFIDRSSPTGRQSISRTDIDNALTAEGHIDGDAIHVYACNGAVGKNLKDLKKLSKDFSSPVIAATEKVELRTRGGNTWVRSGVQNGGRWVVITPDGRVRPWDPARDAADAHTASQNATAAAVAARQSAISAQSAAVNARAGANAARSSAANARAQADAASKEDKKKAEQNANKAERDARKAEKAADKAEAAADKANKAAQDASVKATEAENRAREAAQEEARAKARKI